MSCEPTLFLAQKLWCFAEGMHARVLLCVGMFITANGFLLLRPLIFGFFINDLQEHGATHDSLPRLLTLLVCLFSTDFFFWIFHGPARVMERMTAFKVELNYRRYLLKGTMDLGLAWHGEHDSGDTIDKINKAGDGILEFSQSTFRIIQISIRVIGTSIILMFFSPLIGVLVFCLVLFAFFIIFQFDKRLLPQYRALNELSNKASASVFDSLSNITTVKILHIEKPVLSGVVSRYQKPFSLFRSNAHINEYKWFTGNMIFQLIGLIPIAGYVYYHVSHGQSIDAGRISTLYLYLSDLMLVFFDFGSFYEMLGIYKNRVINAEPIEQAFIQKTQERRETPVWNTLRINNLSFSYDNAVTLKNISLEVKRGDRIAVIGESGSGKTTFLKVIHGMYPTATCELEIDHQKLSTNFADIDLKTMLVPQEPEIFSSTIRENITLGIEYSEAAIMHAAEIAAFDKVLIGLPKGLESLINEKGVNLSGGQKQRLALTRALLFAADKELILLDESTSSVDPSNELEIYQRIWNNFKGKTIIASIHKTHLLGLFDNVVTFENGQIVNIRIQHC